MLIEELDRTGINARRPAGVSTDENPILVHVGMKPSPEEKIVMQYMTDVYKSMLAKKPVPAFDSFSKFKSGSHGNRLALPNR
jgi:hypothetical protein